MALEGLDALIAEERAKYRQPRKDTKVFRVRLNGVKQFRRSGVLFTTDNTPYDLPRADLSEARQVELLNTPTLTVEELPDTPAPAAHGRGGREGR